MNVKHAARETEVSGPSVTFATTSRMRPYHRTMTAPGGDIGWPARWATEAYLYLTTNGRKSGRPRRIEIWFAAHGGRIYMLSGGRERSNWVRNIQANARVRVELGDETRVGLGRVITPESAEDQLARDLLVRKYAATEGDLDEWGRTSLPVVIEFPANVS